MYHPKYVSVPVYQWPMAVARVTGSVTAVRNQLSWKCLWLVSVKANHVHILMMTVCVSSTVIRLWAVKNFGFDLLFEVQSIWND